MSKHRSKSNQIHQDQGNGNTMTFQRNQVDEYSPAFSDIQLRAYQLYEERGGTDFDNWIEAERILRKKRGD